MKRSVLKLAAPRLVQTMWKTSLGLAAYIKYLNEVFLSY